MAMILLSLSLLILAVGQVFDTWDSFGRFNFLSSRKYHQVLHFIKLLGEWLVDDDIVNSRLHVPSIHKNIVLRRILDIKEWIIYHNVINRRREIVPPSDHEGVKFLLVFLVYFPGVTLHELLNALYVFSKDPLPGSTRCLFEALLSGPYDGSLMLSHDHAGRAYFDWGTEDQRKFLVRVRAFLELVDSAVFDQEF
jgi:hypothetical protein